MRRLLRALRWRIRAYVFIEGVSAAAIWLGLTFWAGLALDYVPVMMGASEMPRGVRLVLLIAIAVVLGVIIYQWIIRRSLVRLKNRSMALLLERRFPKLNDSLLTTVELTTIPEQRDDYNPELLERSSHQALNEIQSVRLRQVFNFAPVMRNLLLASLACLSIAAFTLVAREASALWIQRMYLLSNEPWPRRAYIEVLGFEDRLRKIGKGSDITIQVRADAQRDSPPPEVCTIVYHTAEGDRGRVNMSKNGGIRDGFQHYSYAGKPFRGILTTIRFDVVGLDYRVRDYVVRAVDPPNLMAVTIDSEMPAYTGLTSLQNEPWSPGMRLPKGSQVRLQGQSTKPLVSVTIHDPQSEETWDVSLVTGTQPVAHFDHDLGQLDRTRTLEIRLRDTDGVESRQAHRITIDAIEDTPPNIDVRLSGIGTAVTPNARLPVLGRIKDDYGVERVWFSLETADGRSFEIPFTTESGGDVDAELDLRTQRADEHQPVELAEGQHLRFVVIAADRFDLGDGPNVGIGDQYELDVVSASDLLARLEARELNLRRRFEQIIVEMKEARDSLARVNDESHDNDPPPTAGSAKDLNSPSSLGDATDRQSRSEALRLLRVQRAAQYSQRASQEVYGVAASFDDIREELVNNRVDTKERIDRLENLISKPLKRVADEHFFEWSAMLKELESQILTARRGELTDAALARADQIIVALEEVLAKMIELEDYNELIDLVRSILRDQDELIERTKKERRNQLLGP